MSAKDLRADLDQVVGRYEAGEHSTDLAAEYGTSYSTVLKYLRERGVTIRPRGGGEKCPPKMSANEQQQLVDAVRRRADQTLDELAAQFGVSRSTIRRMLVMHGVDRRPIGPRPNPIPRRERPPKKPIQTTVNGYTQVWLPVDDPYAPMCQGRGWVLEHRLVMARHLGRPLNPTETVHHRNGKRKDNRIENLELRQGQHGNGQSWRCADCGSRNLVAI